MADGSLYISKVRDFIKDMGYTPHARMGSELDFDRYAKHPNRAANLKKTSVVCADVYFAWLPLPVQLLPMFSPKICIPRPERVVAKLNFSIQNMAWMNSILKMTFSTCTNRAYRQSWGEVARRWPGKMKFAFPNGLRGDILDQETVDVMCEAGTYAATIAMETVTPRLQDMVEKYLDIDKASNAIKMFTDKGLQVTAAFMLGFPTETRQRNKSNNRFALKSNLTLAYFFTVIPSQCSLV
ncbi:MAG: hypothetical protein IPK95_04135 [Cellvibrionales bacterium]|nr:hypothetical protein [Cellvibrionales bacterium]